MPVDSRLHRLMHLLSPNAWLLVVFVSVLLASGSAYLLAVRMDRPEKKLPGVAFDSVERFVRDTNRLTFKDRALGDALDGVFVAPKGILNQDASFKWVESAAQEEQPGEAAVALSIAPARLLDPAWTPPFAGLSRAEKTP